MIATRSTSSFAQLFGRRQSVVLVAVMLLITWSDFGGMPQASAAEEAGGPSNSEPIVVRRADGAVALRYLPAASPWKPYLQEWRTPAGHEALADGFADHAHHHGLMFGLGVDQTNFWHEAPRETVIGTPVRPRDVGRQQLRELASTQPSSAQAAASASTVDQVLQWEAGDGTPLVIERRKMRFDDSQAAAGLSSLTWESELTPAVGREQVSLWGSYYYGLGMRLPAALTGHGTCRSADGQPPQVVRDDERLYGGRWFAYQIESDPYPFSLLLFADPDNDRPAAWFAMTRPFAYLAATPSLDRKPLNLPNGKTLRLRYGVVIADNTFDDAEIDRLYDRWRRSLQPAEQP